MAPPMPDLPHAHVRVLSTGGQVDEIVTSLIAAARESDAKVREAIASSLHNIGRHQPALTITACGDWLVKSGSNPTNEHRIIILNTIRMLLEEKAEAVTPDIASETATMAMEQLIMDREIVPDLQEAACGVIVALASHCPEVICDYLMRCFVPGQIPHYFVVKALGDVSSANPLGVVPRLRDVIQRMNPLLGTLKHDNLKWVFADAYTQFCDAIQTYVANIDKGSDKSISESSFSVEFGSAYELLSQKWITTKDRKLLPAILRALGQMSILLAPETYEQVVGRLITLLIQYLRREKDAVTVMQAFCTVLTAGAKIRSPTLQQPTHVQEILSLLHTVACAPPSFDNPVGLKFFNEALRCCEVMARTWPEPVLAFFLSKLEPKDAVCRLGAVNILKHVVLSVKAELEDRKALIVSGVKTLVAQSDLPIPLRKALAQLISAMASNDYLQLEGGQSLLEFIVRCCSYGDTNSVSASASQRGNSKANAAQEAAAAAELELRDMCENILFFGASTIETVEQALWPYILELVVPHQYTPAAAVLAKCIAQIAGKKRENGSEDYWIDFEQSPNLPKPQQLIAKLFIVLCNPAGRPQQGIHILNALRSLGPVLHPAVCDMWDEKMPKLVAYLEDRLSPAKAKDWDPSAWEELVVRMLSETLKNANDDEWAMALGDALASQIELYASSNNPYLRSLAIKQLGVVIQRNSSKEFVRSKLEFLFQTTNHKDEQERNGCASAVGYAAATHLDNVVEKMQEIFNACTGKKSGGGGGFFRRSAPVQQGVTFDVEAKNTAIVAYGQIATHAPPSLITTRIEIHVLNIIRPCFPQSKAPGSGGPLPQRCAVATAINLIARAMHPSHLRQPAEEPPFEFKPRDELLQVIVSYLTPAKETELDVGLRLDCLDALASLALLSPALPDDVEEAAVSAAARIYSLPIATGQEKGVAALLAATEEQMSQLTAKFDNLLAALLFMEPSVAKLRRLASYLVPFLHLDNDLQRERATAALLNLLRKFIQFAPSKHLDTVFTDMGELLSVPLPRCADTNSHIRRTAIECMGLMLYIDHLLQSQATQTPPPEALKKLNAIRDRVESGGLKEQLAGLERIGAVIADAVKPVSDVFAIVVHGLHALSDKQESGQMGAAAALNILCLRRGDCLGPHVPDLVDEFHAALQRDLPEKTREVCLTAFCSFAQHHIQEVVTHLLDEPVPHTPAVTELFAALVRDERTAAPLFFVLANVLNTTCLHEEKRIGTAREAPIHTPLQQPMGATAAFADALLGREISKTVRANLEIILITLLLRAGTCVYCEAKQFTPRSPFPVPPEPLSSTRASLSADAAASAQQKDAKQSAADKKKAAAQAAALKPVNVTPSDQIVTALQCFVKCLPTETQESVESFMEEEGAWDLIKSQKDFTQGITLLVRALVESDEFDYARHADKLYQTLAPFLRGNYLEQRIVAVVVFAELIAHSGPYPELLHKLIIAMTEGLAEPALKLHVLRGLANVATAGPEAANTHSKTVIDALNPPLSGSDEVLTLEAMNGLGKVFEVVDEAEVAPFLVNLCTQIRPSFEHNTASIRAAAFALFGTLTRFGTTPSCCERFTEQVHSVIPPILLHLYDEDQAVQEACKATLRRVAPLTKAESFIALVESDMFDAQTPIDSYETMAEALAKELIQHFPQRVPFYLTTCCGGFHSQWDRIKANAAVMVGMLLGNLPEEKRDKATLNPTIITRQLLSLLKERSREVRQKAAEAMSVLYTY